MANAKRKEETQMATPQLSINVNESEAIDFFSLPENSQRVIAQKGWDRFVAERQSGAYTKALNHYLSQNPGVERKNVARSTVAAQYVEDGAPNRHMWDQWQSELAAQFRDAAIAGVVESTTRSPGVSMRHEAAMRVIAELVEEINAQKVAAGEKPIYYFAELKKGKGVGAENEKIRAKNEAKLQKFLDDIDNGVTPHGPRLDKHLADVKRERDERRAAGKGTSGASEELDDLDFGMQEAAQ